MFDSSFGIPAIDCKNCLYYAFDDYSGMMICFNPDNPDAEQVDEYGVFGCRYFVDWRMDD